VERPHNDGTLADRGYHPLDRAVADVADGEDAGEAGLEDMESVPVDAAGPSSTRFAQMIALCTDGCDADKTP
jgi:hypothetical protein